MTTNRREYQPCRLVSYTGCYFTPTGTFSPDPARALTAERWWLEREQARITVATLIIRAE